MATPYDSILVVSFGGPEGPDEVLPFLENVLRGKNVPRERMLEVAEHYQHFGGVSPINAQNRALIGALEAELAAHGPPLPIYWGNRNWHPLLPDALRKMQQDGRRRALAFVTSAYSSYSSCRQYLEDIERARQEVGKHAPQVDKLRAFFNHPGFIEPLRGAVHEAVGRIPPTRHATTRLVFSAHSIPQAMADGCAYASQLESAATLVAAEFPELPWRLVYQSRSGPPQQAWLEPDVGDDLAELAETGACTDVVLVPIGFTSDHMEVLYDLDDEARGICHRLGLNMIRVPTVGTHPEFVRMIRELILERTAGAERRFLGSLPPNPDICPHNCCPSGRPISAQVARSTPS